MYMLISILIFIGMFYRFNLYHHSVAHFWGQLCGFLVKYSSSGCRLGYLTMLEKLLLVLGIRMVLRVSSVELVPLFAGRSHSTLLAQDFMENPRR